MSRQISKISTVSICLDDLDKYLDEDKTRLKSLNFKNLDREKKKVDLDVMDNLDTLKKLVSTRRTFSISISTGLDCRDPQGYVIYKTRQDINDGSFNIFCFF